MNIIRIIPKSKKAILKFKVSFSENIILTEDNNATTNIVGIVSTAFLVAFCRLLIIIYPRKKQRQI